MFGADYPLFTYERLMNDWKALGYDDEVLGKVMNGNASRLFGLAA
jgi:predicted TIM-barrel fold metal-dependent hydrolase